MGVLLWLHTAFQHYNHQPPGVSNIDEVIQKFENQSATNKHLLELQTQTESKLDALKLKRADVLAQFEDLKLQSDASNAHTKRMIAEFQGHLEKATAAYAEAKDKYERAAKVMANARSGIQHLSDKQEGIVLVWREKEKMFVLRITTLMPPR